MVVCSTINVINHRPLLYVTYTQGNGLFPFILKEVDDQTRSSNYNMIRIVSPLLNNSNLSKSNPY